MENKEKPEIYAVNKCSDGFQFSRRDFLKAAGAGAAAVSLGLKTGGRKIVSAANLESICANAAAHSGKILLMGASENGKYLVSVDDTYVIKCWSFSAQPTLLATGKINGNSGPATAIAFDTNQQYVYIGFQNDFLQKFSLPDLDEIDSIHSTISIKALVPGNNGSILAIGDTANCSKYTDGNLEQYSLPGEIHPMDAVPYLYGRKWLAIGKDGALSGNFENTDKDNIPSTIVGDRVVFLRGDARVICMNGTELSCHSILREEMFWKQSFAEMGNGCDLAATPDGSTVILHGAVNSIYLVSTADGTVLKKIPFAVRSGRTLCICADGKIFAASSGKRILFWSLPDGKLEGCPIDLKEQKETVKGVEIKQVDEATGETVTFTLPCGAEIPDGAVCVCNCVGGDICSCDSYVYVAPETQVCTCDTVCTCNTEGGHYWHPN